MVKVEEHEITHDDVIMETVSFPPAHHHDDDYQNTTQAFPPQQSDHAPHFPPQQSVGGGFVPPQFPPPQENAFQTMGPPPPPPYGNNFNYIYNNQLAAGAPIIMNDQIVPNQPWSSSLFACMDNPENAIITFCFPCITFGQIAEIVNAGNKSCATSGMWYSLLAFCIGMPCLISCGYRTRMRIRFGIIESPAPDWVVHCFCEWCALCQEYRELQARGLDPSIGWIGNMAKQQQQQQNFGMTPPMQQRMM